jgi:hypothetical protein
MWSIGTGEGSEEDGQVEKSVAEAMAGVEPNARSRKASYSLRFFKEGLPPEDKTRRKDAKSALRERLSPTIEERSVGSLGAIDKGPLLPPPADAGLPTPRSAEARNDNTPTIKEAAITVPDDSAGDYFTFSKGDATHSEATPSKVLTEQKSSGQSHADICSGTPKLTAPPSKIESNENGNHDRGHGDSGDLSKVHDTTRSPGADVRTSTELDVEAEDSGEEKISSAVFLPHQELTGSDVMETFTGDADWTAPRQRSLSQSKTRPWLVKADEPEPEPQEDVIEDDESALEDNSLETPPSRDVIKTGVGEQPCQGSKALPQADHQDPKHVSPRKPLSQVTQKQIDDHAHDHPLDAHEQLEAIELKPYKHQVGGHTTLWRFSRRAVCKQLNNRENEFYEIVERYHRDLLSFLPR